MSTRVDGVEPADAGAASGLVNVMQQVGGSLGLAVLVTVFGSASSHAAAHPEAGDTAQQIAHHALVVGADRAFLVATLFLAATMVLIRVAMRPTQSDPVPVATEEAVLVDA